LLGSRVRRMTSASLGSLKPSIDCSHTIQQLTKVQCMRAAHRQRQRNRHTASWDTCIVSDAQPSCRRASHLRQDRIEFRMAFGTPGQHLVSMRQLRTVDAGCLAENQQKARATLPESHRSLGRSEDQRTTPTRDWRRNAVR
jgi:hypothetical protein